MSDSSPPAPSASALLSGKPSPRRRLALILALSFVAAAAFQGTRGLYETTEGRYAECARETFASGDLDDPILFGKPHWTKPPLTYWAIGGGMEVLGTNTWGARAFLIFTFVGTVAAVYFQGRRLWRDDDSALAGALVYATSLVTLAGANIVSTDSLLTFWCPR